MGDGSVRAARARRRARRASPRARHRALHCGHSARSRQNCLSHERTLEIRVARRPDRGLAGLSGGLARERARPPRDRRLRRGRARRALRHPRLHLRRGRHPPAGRAIHAGLRGAHRRLRGHLREQGAPLHGRLPADREAGPLGRRRLGRRASHGAGRRLRSRPGSTCTATTRPRHELRYAFDSGVGHLILDSFDEIELAGPAARPAPAGPDPRDARDQAVDPRLRADRAARLQVRLRARRRARRAGRRAGAGVATPRAGRAARPHRLADLRARALREGDRGDRRFLRARSTSRPSCSTSAAGSASPTCDTDEPPSIDDYVEVKVARRAARLRPGAADPGRAGPLAGRQRRDHRLPGRDRQGDSREFAPTSRSTAGCRTTCGRCSTAPATRR